LCGALLAALLGCKSEGVLGEEQAALECEPACSPIERCDRQLGMCVACGDDCEGPVDAGAVEDASMCGEGGCCEEDNDCDGEGNRECQNGRCVETDDDDEEEDEEDELPDEP
jgi:hypothetical protein